MDDALSYYAAHSPITDPKALGQLLEDLPTHVPDLCRIVQGLLFHYSEGDLYGVAARPHRQRRRSGRTHDAHEAALV